MDEGNVQLIGAIKRLPCFIDTPCEIAPISQGLSHRCFKVDIISAAEQNSTSYFVKYLGDHPVSASNELHASQLASDRLLSPHVNYCSQSWLVSRFIDGEILATLDLPLEEKYRLSVQLLAKCHQLAPSHKISSYTIGDIIKQQLLNSRLLPKQRDTLHLVCQQLLNFNERGTKVLCHGDANFSNMLLSADQTPWLIDFECAFVGYPEFDIAMLIAINNLPTTHLEALISAYEKISTLSLDINLVQAYLPCCYLINGLWYRNHADESQSRTLYLQLADQQFRLFDQLNILAISLTELLN